MSSPLPLLGVGYPTFLPTDIAGLKLWLKAGALALNDGDPVTTWTDASGQGNHATQGTAGKKPTYRTGIINGKPVVRFDGTDDYLQFADVFSLLTAGEIFIVVKIDADPPGAAAQSGLWTLGSDTQNTHFPFTDGIIYDQFGTTARKATVDPTPALTSFRLYNISAAIGNWTSRLNSSQIFTTGTNTIGFTTAPVLGAGVGGATYFLDGDIAEVILYDSVLSSGNRANVESYLNGKYALY